MLYIVYLHMILKNNKHILITDNILIIIIQVYATIPLTIIVLFCKNRGSLMVSLSDLPPVINEILLTSSDKDLQRSIHSDPRSSHLYLTYRHLCPQTSMPPLPSLLDPEKNQVIYCVFKCLLFILHNTFIDKILIQAVYVSFCRCV